MVSQPIVGPGTLRFGEDFELDVRAYELRSAGIPLKLKPIAMELLLFLVERRGELITRDQIVERIWGKGVFLDTDNSINGAISKIRQVLRDDADQPRYVQTVSGRGYRFIAQVTEAGPPPAPEATTPTPNPERLIGRKISHYRILQLLGGGGMGVVYKAEDLKLGRQVAMKFLPGELTGDPVAFERLQREARAASALDHPNICAIHELGEHEGVPFIVMQLLEGQTLRDWIETAPGTASRIKQLLDLGIQIADGLEAAHQKDIIHRDIKPANIFITSRGQARILDFGVAKFVDAPELAEAGRSKAVTEGGLTTATDPHLTRTGISLGTPSYLSPEQIRREKLDARTDLFSFGLVLYEMATGQRTFAGNTATVIRDAVLNLPAVPVRQLNPDVPVELERIIGKALEKDRERRYQHASEIRVDLGRLQSGMSNRPGSTTGISTEAAYRRGVTAIMPWTAVLGLAVLILLMAGVCIYLLTRGGPVPFRDFTITQISDTGRVEEAAISPDAKYVSYLQNDKGEQSLWLRNIRTGSDTQILPPSPAHLQRPVFSPDGNYVYFQKSVAPAVRDLYRLPVLGGAPQFVTHDVDSNVIFSPDARRIACIRGNDPELGKYQLLSANPDGSDETVLDHEKMQSVGNNDFPRFAAWSGDGRRIAYQAGRFAAQTGAIKAFDLIRKRESLLARLPKTVLFEMAWLSSNRLLVLYSENGPNSGHVQVGVASIETSELQPVTRDTNSYFSLTVSADKKTAATVQVKTASTLEIVPLVSRKGRIAAEHPTQVEHVNSFGWTTDGNVVVSDGSRISQIAADGTKKMTLVNDSASILGLATCPNGYVLVNWVAHGEGRTIWRINSDGSNAKQLTHGVYDTSPTCSPDGKWVYYMQGILALMRVPIEGGQEEIVPGSKVPNLLESQGSADFSPDGKQLLLGAITFFASSEGAKSELAIIDLDANSGSAPRLIDTDPRSTTTNFSGGARFTPDGKAVIYAIVDQGAWNLWMQPLDGSPGHQITNFASGRIAEFRWSPDGKTLGVVREHDTSDVVVLRDAGR